MRRGHLFYGCVIGETNSKSDFAWQHIQAHKFINKRAFSKLLVAPFSKIGRRQYQIDFDL